MTRNLILLCLEPRERSNTNFLSRLWSVVMRAFWGSYAHREQVGHPREVSGARELCPKQLSGRIIMKASQSDRKLKSFRIPDRILGARRSVGCCPLYCCRGRVGAADLGSVSLRCE